MSFKRKHFIKVENSLFDKLTTEEMYIYCYLKFNYNRNLERTTTSIDIIADEISLVKDNKDNKRRIKNIVLSLVDKKIINSNKQTFKNTNALRITFEDMGSIAHTQIPYVYSEINDNQEFYVVTTLCKWSNAKDKTFSLDEWADMLNVSRPTILAIFERMEQQGLLYVVSGDYYQTAKGELRQENNRYYLVDGQAKVEDESVVDKLSSTVATVDEVTTVEPAAKVVTSTDNLGMLEVTEATEHKTHFNFCGESHNVKEILAHLQHTDKKNPVYMQEVDYVWYQLNKQFLDKKTVNLVEAKLKGMNNSKSDYPKKLLAEWKDSLKQYHKANAEAEIKETAKTQPIFIFKDGSWTTDTDKFDFDYNKLASYYAVYEGEVVNIKFETWHENAEGQRGSAEMTALKKEEMVRKIVDYYKQQNAKIAG